MKEKIYIEKVESWHSTRSGSTGSLTRIHFLEHQLLNHGIPPGVVSSIADLYPNIETFGELLEVLE